jgi:hypothetical protein
MPQVYHQPRVTPKKVENVTPQSDTRAVTLKALYSAMRSQNAYDRDHHTAVRQRKRALECSNLEFYARDLLPPLVAKHKRNSAL